MRQKIIFYWRRGLKNKYMIKTLISNGVIAIYQEDHFDWKSGGCFQCHNCLVQMKIMRGCSIEEHSIYIPLYLYINFQIRLILHVKYISTLISVTEGCLWDPRNAFILAFFVYKVLIQLHLQIKLEYCSNSTNCYCNGFQANIMF